LQQVQGEQHYHRLRHEMMHGPQQPAALHFILNVINAFPRRLARRAVSHPQEQPGNHLRGEREDQRAAEDISPARAARDVLVQRFVKRVAIAGAMIEPVEQALHGG